MKVVCSENNGGRDVTWLLLYHEGYADVVQECIAYPREGDDNGDEEKKDDDDDVVVLDGILRLLRLETTIAASNIDESKAIVELAPFLETRGISANSRVCFSRLCLRTNISGISGNSNKGNENKRSSASSEHCCYCC